MDSAEGLDCNNLVRCSSSDHRVRHSLFVHVFRLDRRILGVSGFSDSRNRLFFHHNYQPNFPFDAIWRDCCYGLKLDIPHEVHSGGSTESIATSKNSRSTQTAVRETRKGTLQIDSTIVEKAR